MDIVQKIRVNTNNDKFIKAEKYYELMSCINSLNLTKREIQLIAFTAVSGNISYSNIKQEFCLKYKSTAPTINNMISKLKKMHVLVKDKNTTKVNPAIILPFDRNITLEIKL